MAIAYTTANNYRIEKVGIATGAITGFTNTASTGNPEAVVIVGTSSVANVYGKIDVAGTIGQVGVSNVAAVEGGIQAKEVLEVELITVKTGVTDPNSGVSDSTNYDTIGRFINYAKAKDWTVKLSGVGDLSAIHYKVTFVRGTGASLVFTQVETT